MKSLNFIIKYPTDDYDPLGEYRLPDNTMSVGMKFEAKNGQMYGDYVLIGVNSSDDVIIEAMRLLLKQARETERATI